VFELVTFNFVNVLGGLEGDDRIIINLPVRQGGQTGKHKRGH
jgi:hypothetical protein